MMNIDQTIAWLKLGRGQNLQAVVEGMPDATKQEFSRALSDLAQAALWAETYVDLRGALGCGDSGDSKARVEADKRLKAMRKAMGYTYP